MQSFNLIQKLKENWKSGLTVALVSIPLAVSLSIASGASPTRGVIAAIWSGFIASIFGGSNFNVIGPTGALSGILATYAAIYGEQVLPILAILSGLIIIFGYFLNVEKYLVFFPSSTIQGFILGVAIIIIFNQINFALGLNNLPVHEHFIGNVFESIKHINEGSLTAFSIFLFFAILLLILIKKLPKIPGAVIVSIIGIIIGFLSTYNYIPIKLLTLNDRFSNLDPKLFLPFKLIFSIKFIIPAIIIALVSILETMISARIADGMTKTKYKKKREILGLGLANIGSGFAGGIPTTAALARTSLNINAGATHKISTAISSIFIIIISFLLLNYFKFMPLAIIASILTIVGVRMIELESFIKMYKIDKQNLFIGLIVALITILEDPMAGLLLGALICMLLYMQKLSQGQYELFSNKQDEDINLLKNKIKEKDCLVYVIKGSLAYINAQSHISRFEKTNIENKNVIIDLKNITFIDQDGIEAIDEIVDVLESKNKTVIITLDTNSLTEKMFLESEKFLHLKNINKVFASVAAALDFV
ncbi:MAG: hypothetical protein SZ59_C0002G0077 [candidate division TM6 bacterium GW2011_GWF2_28_16]|nr:MAG: hypothetical protein SZ59_C0002G0077 [candidate division TM6 bacterium GW2011_GWF2_28_16]